MGCACVVSTTKKLPQSRLSVQLTASGTGLVSLSGRGVGERYSRQMEATGKIDMGHGQAHVEEA